jgi:hypothetical protein
MLAVGDIRLLSSLHKGCAADAAKLCPNVQPGSGRVIGCLQQNSGGIQSSSCRRQLMRLQGFAAHDYRLDYQLRQVRQRVWQYATWRFDSCTLATRVWCCLKRQGFRTAFVVIV